MRRSWRNIHVQLHQYWDIGWQYVGIIKVELGTTTFAVEVLGFEFKITILDKYF